MEFDSLPEPFAYSHMPEATSNGVAIMPLYDYECVKCAHVFEVFHKLSEEGTDFPCPKCGAGKSRKLVSQFKTDAWSKFLDTMEKKVNPHKFK